jgi:transcriptional regulator with XRE-family HTH domain
VFLKILVDKRKSAKITQQQLALRLGKPQSYVSKLEGAERRMDIVEFLSITSALGVDPCAILRKLAKANP